MKNIIPRVVIAIIANFTLLLITFILTSTINSLCAQSFHSFMNDVNVQTGIITNDYQSNLKKVEILGYKGQTLWSLYEAKISISKPITITKTQKEVITPVVNKVFVDSLKMLNTALTKEIQAKDIHITELNSELVVANTIIENLQIQVSEYRKSQYTHQKGDVIEGTKNYKVIKNIRTGKLLTNDEFDKLYDTGEITHLKNKMWIYNPKPIIQAKRE